MGRLSNILTATVAAALLATSCAPTSTESFVRRTTASANDHIMFVRAEPQTFGYRRLAALSQVYPDLGIFLQQQKYPDFVAETNKTGNRYLILYYLARREAFASRSGIGKSRQIEFSGPYPVTKSEFATLNQLRRDASTSGTATRTSFSRSRN